MQEVGSLKEFEKLVKETESAEIKRGALDAACEKLMHLVESTAASKLYADAGGIHFPTWHLLASQLLRFHLLIQTNVKKRLESRQGCFAGIIDGNDIIRRMMHHYTLHLNPRVFPSLTLPPTPSSYQGSLCRVHC